MYIQITDNCNMRCKHCCCSCGPRKKNFMSRVVFLKSVDHALDYGMDISIGGGEPTCHPEFWEFMGLMLLKVYGNKYFEFSPWIATNGKNKEDAICLANMAKRGIICAELSRDIYHEEIDEDVVEAFEKGIKKGYMRDPNSNDCRGIRTNSNDRVIYAGRAIRSGIGAEFHCPCEDLFVDPMGNLFSCGCKKEKFGNVFDVQIPAEYYDRDDPCPVDWKKKKEVYECRQR